MTYDIHNPGSVHSYWKPKWHEGDLHLFIGAQAARRGDFPHDPYLTDENRENQVAVARTVVVFDQDTGDADRYSQVKVAQRKLTAQLLGRGELVLGRLGMEGKAWVLADPTDKEKAAVQAWLAGVAERNEDGQVVLKAVG